MPLTVPSSIQAVTESNKTVEDNVTDAVDLTLSSTDQESSEDIISSSLELDIVLHHHPTIAMGRIILVIITSHRGRSLW
jgi:hypothetical protein